MELSNGVIALELNAIDSDIPAGYYMSIEGNIWSTRRPSGGVHKLSGSVYVTSSGVTKRYFKLGKSQYYHNTLFNQAKKSPVWINTFHRPFRDALIETGKRDVVTAKRDAGANTMPMKGGYVIATFKDGGLMFSSKPRVHATLESVRAEMARLATLNPGVTFVSLQIEQTVTASQLVWG
jgi:hypothetical protein